MEKIIIIEDEKSLRENLATFLDLEGYETIVAENGAEGLENIYNSSPDLIFCDINIPIINGYEVFNLLRKNKKTELIPFIFMTSKTQKWEIRKGMDLGADDYLTKPFTLDDFLNTIKTRIEKKNKIEKINEEKYQQILEKTSVGIFILENNKFNHVNQKFTEITGYDNKEIIGKSFESIIRKEYIFADLKMFKNNIENEKNINDIYYTYKYQKKVYIEVKENEKIFKDKESSFYTILDVTDKFKNEELTKNIELSNHSAQKKQEFLAKMSHEIRTPMTGIIGIVDLLLETDLNKQQKEYTQIIKSSSECLLNILNDVLLLSKIESGKFELFPTLFNPEILLNEIKSLYEPLAKPKKIKIDIFIDEDIPGVIYADINKIKEVLANYISNAIKYTDTGSITLKFSKAEKVKNNFKYKISVIDTGIGIDSESQYKLFRGFSQLDNNISRNISGTGLGLTICKEISKVMGGEVGLISVIGEGSDFWFTFVAEKIDNIELPIAKNIAIKNTALHIGLKVLVVEDLFVNQKVISMILKNAGCEVDIAKNGFEALKLFKENKYEIILMDIQMPEMDGVETLNALRNNFQNVPPIIGLSAHAMEGDSLKYINLGFDDYLTKPIFANILYKKLAEWVSKK